MKLLIETKPGDAIASFGIRSKDKSKKIINYDRRVRNDTHFNLTYLKTKHL